MGGCTRYIQTVLVLVIKAFYDPAWSKTFISHSKTSPNPRIDFENITLKFPHCEPSCNVTIKIRMSLDIAIFIFLILF